MSRRYRAYESQPHVTPLEVCPAYLVMLALNGISPDELELDQLQQLLGIRYAIEHAAEIGQCLFVAYARQGGESISLACGIALSFEEG